MSGTGMSSEVDMFRKQLERLAVEGNRIMIKLDAQSADNFQKALNNMVVALTHLEKVHA